jgi:hypothetical protein
MLSHERLKPARGQRLTVEVALHFIAALFAQKRQLALRLHSLGNGLKAQAARQCDDGDNNGLVTCIIGNVTHKRLVNLELVNMKLLEVAQRGVAGTEVVNRHAHAALVQPLHDGDGFHRIVHRHALGQLQLQAVRRQTGILQNLRHQIGQVHLPELDG